MPTVYSDETFREKRRWREQDVRLFRAVCGRQPSEHPQRVNLGRVRPRVTQGWPGVIPIRTYLTKALQTESHRAPRRSRALLPPEQVSAHSFPSHSSVGSFPSWFSARGRVAYARGWSSRSCSGKHVLTPDDLDAFQMSLALPCWTAQISNTGRRSNQNGGTLAMSEFLGAMYCLSKDRKVRQLCDEKISDLKARATFVEHAQNSRDRGGAVCSWMFTLSRLPPSNLGWPGPCGRP